MDEVLEFLKKVGTYYLGTIEDDMPRIRPFGTIHKYDGRLYIQTGRKKDVSKQIATNPKVELCAWDGPVWLRVDATLVDDDNLEAEKSLLAEYPMLAGMYAAGDGNNQVLYLTNATATFYILGEYPGVDKVITF